MDSQDTTTLYLFKLWSAIEANKNRVIGGAVAIVLIILLALFLSYQRDQKEVTAGQALSQLLASVPPNTPPASLADQYLKVAGDYSGTLAGQRALLQGAAALFAAGNYADAQVQFQKFTTTYSGSAMVASAALGNAASLDALGKTDAAADAYKNVMETYSSTPAAISAKYALAGICERQGKFKDAITYYQELARALPGSTLGQQAAQHSVELAPNVVVKAPVTPAPSAPAMPLSK